MNRDGNISIWNTGSGFGVFKPRRMTEQIRKALAPNRVPASLLASTRGVPSGRWFHENRDPLSYSISEYVITVIDYYAYFRALDDIREVTKA